MAKYLSTKLPLLLYYLVFELEQVFVSYSRLSNKRNSPLINYSVFLPPTPTLFSTPRLLILDNFASLPFYSRLPVY